MKKILKATVLLLTVAITLSFSGCSNNVIEKLMTDYESEEELFITHGRDTHSYVYSQKIKVTMRRGGYSDSLEVRTGTDEDCFWNVILEDDFDKVAWYDYKLFILFDNIYYMLDIEKYEVPESKYDEPVYELTEYSKTQMEDFYPDYESFDWFQTWGGDGYQIPQTVN